MLKVLLFLGAIHFCVDGWATTREVREHVGQLKSGLSLAFAQMEVKAVTTPSTEIQCEEELMISKEDQHFLSSLTFSNLLHNLGFVRGEVEYQMEEGQLSRKVGAGGERFLELYRQEYIKLVTNEEDEMPRVSQYGTAPIRITARKDEDSISFMAFSGTSRGFSSYSQKDSSDYAVKRKALEAAYVQLEKIK